jgi:hypothetical protein
MKLSVVEGGQDGDATRTADQSEGPRDRDAWQGRTVREGVAAADRQRRAGQSGDTASGQLEEDLTLKQSHFPAKRELVKVNQVKFTKGDENVSRW